MDVDTLKLLSSRNFTDGVVRLDYAVPAGDEGEASA